MPFLKTASPQISVRLYKTISRATVDGNAAVSIRYAGKDEFIDLTPFLGEGGSVRTTKSVREPAGGWNITFADKSHGTTALETVYGLVEPMDVIEIRMWRGIGEWSGAIPIVMRGFVSEIQRAQIMSQDGRPMRTVTVSGQDYGKIWQTFQVLHLPAYTDGKAMLTSFSISELFDFKAVAVLPAGEFVRAMVEKIINPHLKGFLPDTLPKEIPKEILTDDISVKHGTVGMAFQEKQGSVYDIIRQHADVTQYWNELYLEDREDGVHCVYRAAPGLHLSKPEGVSSRKIHDDAPDPVYVDIPDGEIESINLTRSDANLANFYWVNNQRYDFVDDMTRRLFGLTSNDPSVSTKDYANTAVKYYGVRPMYGESQMSGDEVKNDQSNMPKAEKEARSTKQLAWLEIRRKQMIDMNRDNVVFERGSARVKGGPMRADGKELMKAGDYAGFMFGNFSWDAYVVQVDHEFVPFQGFTTTLIFERGEGFARRIAQDPSPYLHEMATR